MRRLFVAVFAVALSVLVVAPSPAQQAATKAPDTVGPFIPFCHTDFAGCSSKITEVQFDQTIADLTDKTNNTCAIPAGVTHNQGVADIVNWLAKHPETASMTVADGAKAAAKALWNCQAKVKTGITSEGVPDTTGRYVAFCADAKNYVKCANQAVEVDLTAFSAKTFNGSSQHCSAPEKTTTQEIYAKTIAWLKLHPETEARDTEDGIAAAIDATWPCH